MWGGGATVEDTPSFTGEAHWGPKVYTNPPPGNQHPKGNNLLVGSEGSYGKWDESKASKQAALFPL